MAEKEAYNMLYYLEDNGPNVFVERG